MSDQTPKPKSKMTETQYRDNFQRIYSRAYTGGNLLDVAVVAALDAGFEFAPKPLPVSLPRVIEMGGGDCPHLVNERGSRLSYEQVEEVLRRAMLYLNLRQQALALCIQLEALRRETAAASYDGYLNSLRAELAKGDT